jgi:hypothetical protein
MLLIFIGELIRPTALGAQPANEIKPNSNSAISTGQQGGITGGTVIINPPEPRQDERIATLQSLTNLYMLSHDGITPEMAAGLEFPPEEWVNSQLDKRHEAWRVHIDGQKVNFYDSEDRK